MVVFPAAFPPGSPGIPWAGWGEAFPWEMLRASSIPWGQLGFPHPVLGVRGAFWECSLGGCGAVSSAGSSFLFSTVGFPCQPLFPPLSPSCLGSFSTCSSVSLALCTGLLWRRMLEERLERDGSSRSLPTQTISRLASLAVSSFNLHPKKIMSRPCLLVHRSRLGSFGGDTARGKWDNPGCGGRLRRSSGRLRCCRGLIGSECWAELKYCCLFKRHNYAIQSICLMFLIIH